MPPSPTYMAEMIANMAFTRGRTGVSKQWHLVFHQSGVHSSLARPSAGAPWGVDRGAARAQTLGNHRTRPPGPVAGQNPRQTGRADPAQPGLRLRHRLQKPAARGFRDPFHGSPRDPQVCCSLAYRETVTKSHLKNFRLPGVRGPYSLHHTPDCDSDI